VVSTMLIGFSSLVAWRCACGAAVWLHVAAVLVNLDGGTRKRDKGHLLMRAGVRRPLLGGPF
jgi:hypothetical protein